MVGSLGATLTAQPRMDWTNLVNVTPRGNSLQKTGGCEGCDDAGATSRQMISGNGFVEFTVGEQYTFWMAGLDHNPGNGRWNDLDFAIRFNGNDSADVMERGQYRGGDTYYTAGDRFRIAVVNGRVRYLRNGMVMYESREAPGSALMFKVVLGSMGASIRNPVIEAPGRRYTSDNYYDSGRDQDRFAQLDRNADGIITRREWDGTRREFDLLDANGDGVLSRRELSRDAGGGVVGTAGDIVSVDPTEPWNDTGLWVEAGDMITFDATGQIRMSDNGSDVATPAGARSGRAAANAPLRSEPAGLLLARIGNSAPVPIGPRRTARAPVSGELYLGVNDDYFADNSGSYRVSITVEPRYRH